MSAIFDIVIFILALGMTHNTLRFLRVAQHSRGKLIGYARTLDDEGDWLYQPIFRFVDTGGREIVASNPRSIWVAHQPRIGTDFDLIYNPANPAQIWRDVWHEVWFGPIVLWAVVMLSVLHAL